MSWYRVEGKFQCWKFFNTVVPVENEKVQYFLGVKQLEFTPVDFLSKAIVDLTRNLTKNFGKIFHFINGSVMHCKFVKKNLSELNNWVKAV